MDTPQPGLTVRRVPIASLHADPANARLHPERNVAAIRSSLARFQQVEPLILQRGTQRIIAGHGRVEAMRELGWESCDVIEVDLDDVQATSLALALNRSAETATWNEPALGRLLQSLKDIGAVEGLGWDDGELDDLLRGLDAPEPGAVEDPGPCEPPAKVITRVGDLWTLGEHRLLCGDSTSAPDIERLMDGAKARLWSSDPPYCVNYTGNDRPIHDGKGSGKDWSAVYDEVSIADLGTFLDGVFGATLAHVVDDAPVYCWHAHVQQPTIAAAFERHGLLLHQVLVWVKPSATFGHSYYRWRHEPCAFGWRQGNKPKHGVGQLDTIWEADWDGKARITTFHPTSKPTRLFEIPMEQHTRPGDVVIEPFNGSGSQIIAAEKLGRRCYAMDIQPAFIDGTIERWEKATGKTATLEGKTYAEVAAERGGA